LPCPSLVRGIEAGLYLLEGEMVLRRVAVVDGSNVAHEEETPHGRPKVSNLVAVRHALEAKGYQVVIIVDAAFRHEADDPEQLELLLKDQVVRQAPAGTDADYFVLETAEQEHGLVVSNDLFQRYRREYPWIDERRVPLMIIDGRVELYERQLRGSGGREDGA